MTEADPFLAVVASPFLAEEVPFQVEEDPFLGETVP